MGASQHAMGEMPFEENRGQNGVLACLGFVVVAGLALAALFSVDYVPTTDGPHHVFSAHVRARLAEGIHGWNQWFEPNFPITNLGFGFLFYGFDHLLPWRPALLATQAIMILMWTLGAFVLAHKIHPQRAWAGLLLGSAAFQWSFYMGFFSYYIASALTLWIITFAISIRSWSVRDRCLISGMLFFQSLCHVLPAATTGIILACLAWARCEPRQRSREFIRVLMMGVPALIIVGLLLSDGMTALGDMNRGEVENFDHLWPPLWTLAKCFAGGPSWHAWPLLILAILGPILNWHRSGGYSRMSETDRGLLMAAGILGFLCLGLPLHLRAWDFFSVRFIPPAMAAALLLLPFEKWETSTRRSLLIATSVIVAFFLAAWPIAFHHELDERTRPVLAGLKAEVARRGPRLPVILDAVSWIPQSSPKSPMPFARPLGNVGLLYALEQGGLGPHNFAVNPKLHYLKYSDYMLKEFPEIPDPERAWATVLARPESSDSYALRGALTTKAASFGTRFEDLIFYGSSAENEILEYLGYVMDFREGNLSISHFEGCPLEIELPEKLRDLEGTQVEVGWYPLKEVAKRHSLPEAQPGEQGPIRFSLPEMACGTIWYRVRSRPDVPEDPRSGIHYCEGSNEFGKKFVKSVRETSSVVCRLSEDLEAGKDILPEA